MSGARDHGGDLDAAMARFGGARGDWIDLSTGINPAPYPLPDIPMPAWHSLPEASQLRDLLQAARTLWQVPDHLDILAAPGASALIALMPHAFRGKRVAIANPTYNEHAAAFRAQGWTVDDGAAVRVLVHPNNPDGRLWTPEDLGGGQTVIDESFCDCMPGETLLPHIGSRDIILKSFGKFWGHAGLRLGFAIGWPEQINLLRALIGPWAVSGPALVIATAALRDEGWHSRTRDRLQKDAARLDRLVPWRLVGGTPLFRLYETQDAAAMQEQLARARIWSRRFPYSDKWIRLGLPPHDRWDQLAAAF